MAKSLVHLLDAFADGPPRLKGGQARADFLAIDPIVAGVRAGITGISHFGVRHDLRDHVRDVAYAIVLGGNSDVERLVMDEFPRSLENGDERSRDILDMHQRTP